MPEDPSENLNNNNDTIPIPYSSINQGTRELPYEENIQEEEEYDPYAGYEEEAVDEEMEEENEEEEEFNEEEESQQEEGEEQEEEESQELENQQEEEQMQEQENKQKNETQNKLKDQAAGVALDSLAKKNPYIFLINFAINHKILTVFLVIFIAVGSLVLLMLLISAPILLSASLMDIPVVGTIFKTIVNFVQ